MRSRRPGKNRSLLRNFLVLLLTMNLSANAWAQDNRRLQELLYGEALFHAQQQDYLAAISRLQLAEAQGLLPSSPDQARLLLARMKLAYGMHLEAGFDLHAIAGEAIQLTDRNRAWYELARSFYHRGYNQAAAEALGKVQGELPADIVGDHQLLRATLLMSLDRNREAAQALATWQGAPELAAYAYYNRGIALVRVGEYQLAVPELEQAVKMPARGEELLAVRDKSRLSLGYIFARQEDYRRASKQLQAVRPQGPFSNRALLALGWIAYKQGHSATALVSWTELRGRSPADPAVLETLLIVPAVHRELDAMQTATRDYAAAKIAFSGELEQLQEARESVQQGPAVSLLLRSDSGSAMDVGGPAKPGTRRFFGPLLASRNFREMAQDHGELQAMLETVDRGLQQTDSLAKTAFPADQPTAPPATPTLPAGVAQVPDRSISGSPAVDSVDSGGRRNAERAGAGQAQQWVEREAWPTEHPPAGIPRLPEVESPARRAVKPLPGSRLPRPRRSPGFSWTPPPPELIGLPQSEILWLPNSGEFFGRPASGQFFRRPGEQQEEDYAYPDSLPQGRSTPGKRYRYPLHRLLPAPVEEAGFDPGAVPVGEALRELAAALNGSSEGMAQLGGSFDPAAGNAGLAERVQVLRARILKLRARIAEAIARHEAYTRSLALDELDRRQYLLEDLLEQASLELAKTYDQSSNH